MGATGNFFVVDTEKFAEVTKLGTDPAAAYLVVARGTGRDNSTSRWSAHAIEKYTGLSRGRASAALHTLIASGFVHRVREGSSPQYDLAFVWPMPDSSTTAPDPANGRWAWLPNTLVDGVATFPSPVQRVRQAQDPLLMRLLVEAYEAQHLGEHGGIDPWLVSQRYDRVRLRERGKYVVWGFKVKDLHVRWTGFTACHRRTPSPEELRDCPNLDCASDFFRRVSALVSLEIADWVPYLMESEARDAQPIHPYGIAWGRSSEGLEEEISRAADAAARRMLTRRGQGRAQKEMLLLAPVPAHMINVALVGRLRLRHRPWTRMTSAWWADLAQRGAAYLAMYRQLAGCAPKVAAVTGTEGGDVQDQGEINDVFKEWSRIFSIKGQGG